MGKKNKKKNKNKFNFVSMDELENNSIEVGKEEKSHSVSSNDAIVDIDVSSASKKKTKVTSDHAIVDIDLSAPEWNHKEEDNFFAVK